MKSKIPTKQSVALIICGCLAITTTMVFFAHKNKTQAPPEKQEEKGILLPTQEISFGLPTRITIPRIRVDAQIVSVGLTPSGDMEVPKNPTDVAWFNLGSHPGEIGSAVLAGHYGWKDGIPAVFDDLHTLSAGDKIRIEDDKGTLTTFVVRELRTYGEHDDASEVFAADNGEAHLNLVTCSGIWNKGKKSYSSRLVVFADRRN